MNVSPAFFDSSASLWGVLLKHRCLDSARSAVGWRWGRGEEKFFQLVVFWGARGRLASGV